MNVQPCAGSSNCGCIPCILDRIEELRLCAEGYAERWLYQQNRHDPFCNCARCRIARPTCPDGFPTLDPGNDGDDPGSRCDPYGSIREGRKSADHDLLLLELAITLLNPRHVYVITRKFGLDGYPVQTLKEIGDLLGGITGPRVAQLQTSAMRKIGTAMTELSLGRIHTITRNEGGFFSIHKWARLHRPNMCRYCYERP